ncbi:MAG TPA: MMPL family transporter, partial [Thermoleophilaceae bacterium]
MATTPQGGLVQPKGNIAARAGRWSARHRKTAIFGWLAFVVLALVIGTSTGMKTLSDDETGVGDSQKATEIVGQAFPKKASESVLVQSEKLHATDARFQAAVSDVSERLAKVRYVENLDRAEISKDRHSALVNFDIKGDDDQAKTRVDKPLAVVAQVQKAHPGLRVEEVGSASADKALSKAFEDDFKKAEVSSLPLTLIILVIAFGALVAAGIPVLLALSGVGATIGLLGPISHISPVSESINSVILLIGLAVGVDYALFYIRREREERAAGKSEEAALEAAAATSGRAVMISGLTVMVAMAGMYLGGAKDFASFATGTILVVAISVLGSLTVLPAVLSKLGDRVDKGRIPFIGRRRRGVGESRVWSAVLNRVLRRPLVSAVVAVGLLAALALPALGMHTAESGVESIPRDQPVMRTYDRVQAAFPSEHQAADVVVKADDVTSPNVRHAIADLTNQASTSDDFVGAATVDVSPDRTVADVSIPLAGDGNDSKSMAAVAELRDELVPATVGRVAGVETVVGGDTASTKDFNDVMKSHVVWVFAFVLTMAFLLLMVTFRSIVIPVKAIALNLLSVGASYGLLVLVFQKGWGESLLGFHSNGAITAWLPLFLFVVLFGLSMDYHVFILTRIREAFDRGMTSE